MKKITFLLMAVITILIACQKSSETKPELRFQYIQEICCGNLMVMDGETIDNYNESRKDSLTYGVNLDDFISSQNLEFGDEALIEYEVINLPLSDDIEINCSVICNRHNGMPIRILSLEKR